MGAFFSSDGKRAKTVNGMARARAKPNIPIVGANISQKISKEAMGHAFIDLGFERKTYRNVRGYVAVRRTQQEIDLMRKGLAIATDNDTHTLDTPFF